MNRNNNTRAHARKQRGFTLMELIIAITIIAILGIAILSIVQTDSSRATSLVDSMRTTSRGLQRAKMDMGSFPSRLSVLWTRADATSANMYSGQASTTTWNGPYIGSTGTNAANAITMDAISSGVAIALARETGINYNRMYYLRASNVPNSVITAALRLCNGSDATTATFANAECRGSLGTGTVEVGTLDLKVEDTN